MNETKRVRNFALLGLTSFALSFTVGACFTGEDSEGLPCVSASQCAIGQECINSFCNGVFICDDGTFIDAIAVCDLFDDCSNGEDEASELCFGEETDLFECDDGTQIPAEFVCDEEEDCEDGEDELGCAGVGANECSGGGPDIVYDPAEETTVPLMNPLPVVTLDFVGPPSPEVIVASAGGNMLEAISFGDDGNTMMAPLGPFDNGTVADFEIGDVNGDGNQDIVVAVEGDDGFSTYVFQNNAPDMPTAYGTPLSVNLPGDLLPDVRTIELARLNNDSSIDLVAIVDGDNIIGSGRLMVATGDSSAASMGGNYFTPALLDNGIVPAIGYDTFFDAVVGDFDEASSLDDIIVGGLAGTTPTLWMISRTDVGDDAWVGPFEIPGVMIPPAQLAVAEFTHGMGPDLVILDPLMGRIQTMRTQGGMIVPGEVIEVGGSDPQGISVADVNCDARDDFLLYRDESVLIYLGEGMGGVQNPLDPILAELDGTGRGRIAVGEYNGDGTPDIVATVEGGVQIALSDSDDVDEEDPGE